MNVLSCLAGEFAAAGERRFMRELSRGSLSYRRRRPCPVEPLRRKAAEGSAAEVRSVRLLGPSEVEGRRDSSSWSGLTGDGPWRFSSAPGPAKIATGISSVGVISEGEARGPEIRGLAREHSAAWLELQRNRFVLQRVRQIRAVGLPGADRERRVVLVDCDARGNVDWVVADVPLGPSILRAPRRAVCTTTHRPMTRKEDCAIRSHRCDGRQARTTFTTALLRSRSRWMLVLLVRQHRSLDQIKGHTVYRRWEWACDSRPAETPTRRVSEPARSPSKRERALKLSAAIFRRTNSLSCVRPDEGVSVASGHRENSCECLDAVDHCRALFTVRNSGPSFEMFPIPRNSIGMPPRNSIGVASLAQ